MATDPAENNSAFEVALKRRDVEGVAAAYAVDARLVDPVAGLVEGRGAIVAFWRAGFESGIREATFTARNVAHDGRFAYEVGRYTLRLTESDDAAAGQVVDTGIYVAVHRRDGRGSWRFALHMLSPD